MATYPLIKPCPKCGTCEHLSIYRYENRWRHVECDECQYLGPGEGNIRQAIKSHNEKCAALKRAGR